MEYSAEELTEARRQIGSTLHKLQRAVETLRAKPDPEKYRSQITLAVRRIKALEIANHLIEAELERGSMEEKH